MAVDLRHRHRSSNACYFVKYYLKFNYCWMRNISLSISWHRWLLSNSNCRSSCSNFFKSSLLRLVSNFSIHRLSPYQSPSANVWWWWSLSVALYFPGDFQLLYALLSSAWMMMFVHILTRWDSNVFPLTFVKSNFFALLARSNLNGHFFDIVIVFTI